MMKTTDCRRGRVTGLGQQTQLLVGEDGDDLLADLRRLQLRHRVGTSSSSAYHLKSCWSARYWLLA